MLVPGFNSNSTTLNKKFFLGTSKHAQVILFLLQGYKYSIKSFKTLGRVPATDSKNKNQNYNKVNIQKVSFFTSNFLLLSIFPLG